MPFYDLPKDKRALLSAQIHTDIQADLAAGIQHHISAYFSDQDTYIRKAAYLATGRLYKNDKNAQKAILSLLKVLLLSEDEKVRQTVINAAGEIGIFDFVPVAGMMGTGLFDSNHSVRNAVIGSIKKMGEKNPVPVLAFAAKYLHHEDKEIRREICHGIELRGRKHPQDILPMLRELQHDKTKRVRSTLVHVLGQIAYKKGCLETVVADLRTWENKELVTVAQEEIIDVHHRYRNFAAKTQQEARDYILKHF